MLNIQIIVGTALFLLLLYSSRTYGQLTENLPGQNPCMSKTTCNECIQTQLCIWCYKPDFKERDRCFERSSPKALLCPTNYTFNPDSVISITQNKELTKVLTASGGGSAAIGGGGGGGGSAGVFANGSVSGSESFGHAGIVQVRPQRISLQLRAKEIYALYMEYTQAEDYPVDLYYLMDLSKSMEDDKDKLSALGDLLAESMRNITSNFRLGFGSFVDKVVMPYVSTVPKNLKAPCKNCDAPYGYRNVMELSDDTEQFSKLVKHASVSGNLDAPEGGFDAIMQAIVCQQEIGWRKQARRLLVFSTDAGFHYAGDGKLGGIVKPNDGLCHLVERTYSYSSIQDYPSIPQINSKVKEHSINVIFAVTEKQLEVYQELQRHIEGSYSGKLSDDSSNVVDLVKDQYKQISSTVEMKDNATSHVRIKYFSKCLVEDGNEIETSKCGNIKVGSVLKFRIEIEITSCPKDPREWNQILEIYPVGLHESLLIDLQMICSCSCDDPSSPFYKEKAEECSGFGTLKCGLCDCDPSYFGRRCECSVSEMDKVTETHGCRYRNTSNTECEGRGNCVCNRCECFTRDNSDEKIYGPFCECDNFSCDRHEGKVCSGHGTCACGKCECHDNWGGVACNCRTSPQTCYPNKVIEGEPCSGRGKCVCGICECESTDEGRYTGVHCEKCPTCSDECESFKHCVQCQIHKKGPFNAEECIKNCTKFTPQRVEKVEVNEDKNENLCAFLDEDDCRYVFIYYYDDENQLQVVAQKDRECPPKVFLLGIVLGVIAAIVLLGLAILLMWKLFTTIHDRREFAKFEKERMMAKWDTGENPIYKQATSTFKNPTYAGKG